jgi:molybdopterin converting factor small subunit
MKIEILLFGQLTDILKASSVVIEAPGDTDTLQDVLVKQFPQLANANYTMAVNKKTVTGNIELTPGSTVALLPPFSGG